MNSVFIDTNVLVYAYDADAGNKHSRAKEMLLECWETETGVISSQVLQEFYVTVTQKLNKPVRPEIAREVLQTYRAWPMHRPNIDDIIEASELSEKHKLSFWDSLIVVSAQKLGATKLVTEDLQDKQQIGLLTVSNPFK